MIRAEHITKSFDGRVVLDDISIEFLTGKTNLIIGRSGSGKTVLLKTLVGLHEPDSGACGTTIRILRVSISASGAPSARISA